MSTEFWVYKGIDPAGRETCGTVESPDKAAVIDLLRRNGIRIQEIKSRYKVGDVPSGINSTQQGKGLFALILLASLFAFELVTDLESYRLVKMMAPPQGTETMGTVTAIKANSRRVEYIFRVDEQAYKGSGKISGVNNKPPEIGQSITVHYARENPTVNGIYLEFPVRNKISARLLLFFWGASLLGFLMLGSRDNLATLFFLLRHRQPLLRKELASLSGMVALFLFFPFATVAARFAWACAQGKGTSTTATCSTVLLFLTLLITGVLAIIVMITLFVERACRTRLVPEAYIEWREGRAKAEVRKSAKTARPRTAWEKAVGTLVFGLFWSVFSAVGFITFGLPVLLHFPLWLSDSWEPVPCTILSSEGVHGVGFRYGPTTTITYRYFFGGQTYVGSEYKLGLTRAALPADVYHAGQATTCYVNPEWPGHPVLKIAESWDTLQWIIIAILFTIWQAIGLVLVGAGLIQLYRGLTSSG